MSPDALDWTIASTPSSLLHSVAYGAGRFVAVGGSFDPDDGAHGTALSSIDGVTWLEHTAPEAALHGVVFAEGSFVAVAMRGGIYRSQDGQAWEHVADADHGLNAVAYLDGHFVAYGESSTLWTSADAVTWDARDVDDGELGITVIHAVGHRDGRWIIGAQIGYGYDGGEPSYLVLTSVDRSVWTAMPTGQRFSSIVSYGDAYRATGTLGHLFTSLDGASWSALGDAWLVSELKVAGDWLFGLGRGRLYVSADGVTFDNRAPTP